MKKLTRLTFQRKVVHEEVMSRCNHPTADQIYESIHINFPNITKSNVYRNLDILSKEGKNHLISIPGCNRYDVNISKHYNVACKKCGKVEDADISYMEEFDKKVSQKTGFLKHSVIFEAVCLKCQKN